MMILKRKWLVIFLLGYGVFVTLPFLAPAMIYLGYQPVGKIIYLVYSFLCHQLPERSLFFFGPKLMYSVQEIRTVWQNTEDPLILRQFIGNPKIGWKVAWSDRMISLYGGVWLFGLLWGLLAKSGRKISIWVFIFLSLPMVLDGGTHFISDLSRLHQGFRFTNSWLAVLTHNTFPVSFYAGDGLGSFNSWMRWITGLLLSFGLVWWSFPYLEEQFTSDVRSQ